MHKRLEYRDEKFLHLLSLHERLLNVYTDTLFNSKCRSTQTHNAALMCLLLPKEFSLWIFPMKVLNVFAFLRSITCLVNVHRLNIMTCWRRLLKTKEISAFVAFYLDMLYYFPYKYSSVVLLQLHSNDCFSLRARSIVHIEADKIVTLCN